MKKRTSVYIDAELLENAKENKLNLSQLLEWAIKEALNGELRAFSDNLRPCPEGVRGFESRPPHEWVGKRENASRTVFVKPA